MTAMPWTVYGAALDRGLSLVARHDDGLIQTLAVKQWLDDADPVDERLIEQARGPVLDVGCGPGRHVHALVRRGVPVLGIDASPSAVRIASARGGEAVQGDVFDHGLELGVRVPGLQGAGLGHVQRMHIGRQQVQRSQAPADGQAQRQGRGR